MSEKQFRVRFEQEDGRGEIVNEKGVELTARELVDLLNELHEERNYFERKKCEYWNKFNLAHLDNINLQEENEQLKHYKLYEDNKRLQTIIADLKEENEKLRMKLKGDDYIMVSEMLSNLRKTGICDGCKNKDKPVEWYLERGFSITGRVCDRYEPE